MVTPVMVSVTAESKPRVTLSSVGLESTDLTPEQAEQLAAYLEVRLLGHVARLRTTI